MQSNNKQYGVIILAAGQSKRFKSNKLLVTIKEKTIIERTLQPFTELRNIISKICVVTGAYTEELKSVLNGLQINFVHNPDFEYGGMSSSIKVGLNCVKYQEKKIDGIFIHPGDIPFIKTDDILAIIRFHENTGSKIIVPTYENQKGHPLFIDKSLIDSLNYVSEEKQGLRGILNEYQNEIQLVECKNSGILHDIDTVEELQKFKELL
jgi:molybdenum cofactor cytidylyltransferase